jgi:hypothetical protein
MSIVLLQDLIDIKKRKQSELEFYTSQLNDLKLKMSFIKQEINLTSQIIAMIEKEEILDLRKYLKDKE